MSRPAKLIAITTRMREGTTWVPSGCHTANALVVEFVTFNSVLVPAGLTYGDKLRAGPARPLVCNRRGRVEGRDDSLIAMLKAARLTTKCARIVRLAIAKPTHSLIGLPVRDRPAYRVELNFEACWSTSPSIPVLMSTGEQACRHAIATG